MSERRKKERFTLDNEVFIYSSSISAGFVGKIIDISLTGISFSYVVGFSAPDDMNELDILVPKIGSVLNKLPFKTISDEIIQGHPQSTVITRRRSGLFKDLTQDQESELERFIENLA